jgi:hypothetical protein
MKVYLANWQSLNASVEKTVKFITDIIAFVLKAIANSKKEFGYCKWRNI